MTFEQLIQQQRPHVEQVVQDLSRRHYLAPPEVEEFRMAVERALERNDYELLRAFDGRSTWDTYITLVITREFFVFQAALWGQWRPSVAAQRLGPAAMLLEELVARDHFSVNNAIEWMRTTHRVDLPKPRLLRFAEMLGLLPSAASPSSATPAEGAADARLRNALREAMSLVSADDRLILELRFRDRQPLTRIARLLKLDPRPLQRRLDAAMEIIRGSLVSRGIAAEDIEALLEQGDSESLSAPRDWWHLVRTRPSKAT